jgi:GNAT superfamily N-acetyltransferase
MSRSLVHLREAQPGDAARLAALWADVLRRGDADDQHADMTRIIGMAGADPEQSIVVAEYDGAVAGAVHLRLKTVTPLNLDLSVQVMSPTVLPDYRRHGVGRALMEAAVSWAEERGAGFVATAAPTGSRDANRFLARLALGPRATLRMAPTTAVRAKLTTRRTPATRATGRHLTQVLAVRRSLRRSEAQTTR